MRRSVLAVLLAGTISIAACSSSSSSSSSSDPWWKNVKVTDLRGKAEGGQYPKVDVEITDNEFTPRIVRIDPGVTVSWANRGRSVHNMLKAVNDDDFGSKFGTDSLAVGSTYEFAFKKPGVYQIGRAHV